VNIARHTSRGLLGWRGLALCGLMSAALIAKGYTLDWWTIDGGGAMWSAGETLQLSGTIGQVDAGPALAGGGFELTGGFWVVTIGAGGLRGDLNCDGAVNVFDIDPFVMALTSPAEYAVQFPGCDRMRADINGDGAVNAFDIDPFVVCLTSGGCPEP
jgi:hypothetical protein